MRDKRSGFALVWSILAIAVLAVGASAVIIVTRSNAEQQQQLAAQSQRATYTTLQAEVTLQGIDPARVVNPLGAVIAGGEAQDQSSVSRFSVTSGTARENPGSANIGSLTMQGATGTGERGGGFGLTVVAEGDPNNSPATQLNPPTFAITMPLTTLSFPATGWVVLPSNPPGTVYRYTIDGSDPTASSPIWSVATANSINVVNFPARMRMAAFNSDPAYSTSTVAALDPIYFQLPAATMTRSAGGNSTVFTYTDMVSSPANGILLAPAASVAGVPLSVRFTVDGSDPVTSGALYGGSFIVPFAMWNTGSVPATASVRVAVVGPDSRYRAGLTTIALANAKQQIPAPTFSVTSTGGPVAEGIVVGLNAISGAVVRYAKWDIPDVGDPIGTNTTIP